MPAVPRPQADPASHIEARAPSLPPQLDGQPARSRPRRPDHRVHRPAVPCKQRNGAAAEAVGHRRVLDVQEPALRLLRPRQGVPPRPSSNASACSARGRDDLGPNLTRSVPTRPTALARTAPTRADARSNAPSRRRRPGQRSQEARAPWRASTEVRQGRLQGAARGRVRDQPAETAPRSGQVVAQSRIRPSDVPTSRRPGSVAVSAVGTAGAPATVSWWRQRRVPSWRSRARSSPLR